MVVVGETANGSVSLLSGLSAWKAVGPFPCAPKKIVKGVWVAVTVVGL